jgi:hypothetical protein
MKTLSSFSARAGLLCLIAVWLTTLVGCTTRPISNSGYRVGYGGNSLYRGELNQFDVLGEGRTQPITDADIAKALDNPASVKLSRDRKIMLVQSGAMIPDEEMVAQFNQHGLKVVPFSGVPDENRNRTGNATESPLAATYARALRLTAARGDCETIICYWGVLESANKGLATKTVSWVPVLGMAIPDETQHLRIRLTVALVDVRTGNWALYSASPFEDKAVSMSVNRESSDQEQVLKLKRLAYEAALKDLLRLY